MTRDLREETQAVRFLGLANETILLDSIWTRRLERSDRIRPHERKPLIGVGEQIIDKLIQLRSPAHTDLVLRLGNDPDVSSAWTEQELGSIFVPEPRAQLDGLFRSGTFARLAAASTQLFMENVESDIADLRRKLRQVREGALPDGDITPQTQ